MPKENDSIKQRVKDSFEKVLNSNGYGFQFSVINKAHALSTKGKSEWKFETIEFPVEVKGRDTRIDFVLTRKAEQNKLFFLLAECKRANPALSNWCFVKAPYINRNSSVNFERLFLEHVQLVGSGNIFAYAKKRTTIENYYHIGLEIRSDQKGDSKGESGRAIEDAATQVLRGLNGYVEAISKNIQILNESHADLLPVIFTTAQLWGSEVNLSLADIGTGNSDLNSAGFKQLPWLCYQYHLSPGIKHANSPVGRPSQISNLMDSEYVRTIPIVSPSGIEDFLQWSSNLDLYD